MSTATDTAPRSPYAEGLAGGVLRYQRCAQCGTAQTLERLACSHCGSAALAWFAACGDGVVHATTVVHRAPTAEWRALAPYTLVLVDLDEGPRIMAHGTPGLVIGQRVRAQFHTADPQTDRPRNPPPSLIFIPAPATSETAGDPAMPIQSVHPLTR